MKYIFSLLFGFFISLSSVFASVEYQTSKTWEGGYCGGFIILNDTKEVIHNWKLSFQLDGEISSSWNANLNTEGNNFVFTGLDWNNPLDIDQEFKIGLCVDGENNPKNIVFIQGEEIKKENKNTFLDPLEMGKSLAAIPTVGEYEPPFFARNGKLYDSQDILVQLRGVNWFGFAGDSRIPGGLWERNWKDIISQIEDTGFNAIRLPFCPGTIRSQYTNSYSWTNPELVGKDSLELFDLFILELASRGFYILLDMHTPECKTITHTPFVPGYDLDMWVGDWQFVVNRYKNIENVFAVDPKNEPNGDAVWNDKTDNFDVNRKLQVEKISEEILKVNPDLLIFVNGIEKNYPRGSDQRDCEENYSQSYGGNINPIDCYPLDKNKIPDDKLILSPHIYGPSVYPRDYFEAENFPKNMDEIWEKTFGKYSEQYTLIFGEFGGDYKGQDKIWQDALIDYMIEKRIDSFFFWSWNPNSTDTKGLVLDDWKTLEIDKYNNLKRLFFSERDIGIEIIKKDILEKEIFSEENQTESIDSEQKEIIQEEKQNYGETLGEENVERNLIERESKNEEVIRNDEKNENIDRGVDNLKLTELLQNKYSQEKQDLTSVAVSEVQQKTQEINMENKKVDGKIYVKYLLYIILCLATILGLTFFKKVR